MEKKNDDRLCRLAEILLKIALPRGEMTATNRKPLLLYGSIHALLHVHITIGIFALGFLSFKYDSATLL